jgi:hypothetical protein
VEALDDHRAHIAAALAGAIAAEPGSAAAGTAQALLGVAESLAAVGSLDVDDLRHRDLTTPPPSPAALLARVLPFGLATPFDRPRLRRDAYRYAAATGADEGTAVACVGAALVAADLLRFDASMTAIRVRQSLLEDAPMALLNSIVILERDAPRDGTPDDPGAVLQLALSVQEWVGAGGVSSVLAVLGDDGRHVVGTLAAAFAGGRTGRCDVPIEGALRERVERAAGALAALGAGASA